MCVGSCTVQSERRARQTASRGSDQRSPRHTVTSGTRHVHIGGNMGSHRDSWRARQQPRTVPGSSKRYTPPCDVTGNPSLHGTPWTKSVHWSRSGIKAQRRNKGLFVLPSCPRRTWQGGWCSLGSGDARVCCLAGGGWRQESALLRMPRVSRFKRH